MATDLDRGGNSEQVTKVYLGPSLGWVYVQVKPSVFITQAGAYTIAPGDSVILVNVAGSVTLNLPDVRAWLNEWAYRPATGFERAIVVKDLGGNAATNNIQVFPFSGQAIDTKTAAFTMNVANQVLYLIPLKDETGWYAVSQAPGTSGGGGTTLPGGANTNVQYNSSGTFAGDNGFTYNSTTAGVSIGLVGVATGDISLVGLTSGAVQITAQDAAGAWTWKLPNNPGTNGFVLMTDGTGLSTWSTIPNIITAGVTAISGVVNGNVLTNAGGFLSSQTLNQLTVSLSLFDATHPGIVPASGGGTANFLRADGTWTSVTNQDTTYVYLQPTNGSTVLLTTATHTILDPTAGALGNLTLTMPASPGDGRYIEVRSSKTINNLTVNGNAGQSMVDPPANLSVGGAFSAIFKTSNNTWYCTRFQNPSRNDPGYNYLVPTNGGSATLGNTDWHVILDPATNITGYTLTMCPAPQDGQIVNIRASKAFLAISILPNAGQSMAAPPLTLEAGDGCDLIYRLANTTWYSLGLPNKDKGLEFVIDGGGAAITTGVKGDLEIPFTCQIVGMTILGDQTGSIVVDIWKAPYSTFPPVVGNSITSATPPTITTAVKNQDGTLSGWTTLISAGDILRYNVNSVTSMTRVTVSLKARLL